MMEVEEGVELITIPTVADDRELLPVYSTKMASGADLRAHLDKPLLLQPNERALIPTGCRVAIPFGYEIQVRPRSGLALKQGITVLNTPGTIDADYRGEIGVIVINHGKEPFEIVPRMRIAQAVVAKVVIAAFEQRDELPSTERGAGGFGHSGVN